MRAIIIGAGKIGYNIAKLLVQEKHDVLIIDKSEERAKYLQENLDVQVIVGNGASKSVLQTAGVSQADLLVAVTETDEVNMIACMVAKNFGVKKTVARVRSHDYLDGMQEKGLLSGIDLIINPELVTAKEIAKLIDVPEALDVFYYADGKVQLLELSIPPDAPVANKYLKDLKFQYPFIVTAIFRAGNLIIPRGNDQLLPHDIIFVLGKTQEMIRIEKFMGTDRKRAERIMVLGGGYTGYHLAKLLEERKYSIKLIEKDYKRCVELNDLLNNTLVLHGDATDIDILKAEGAGDTDVFVCVTDDDKINLLVGLIVKHLGAKKTIVQVRRSDYIALMENVGIDIGVSPRTLTANAILRFICRGDNVVSVTLLSQESAEMVEIYVGSKAEVANKKLKNLNFPSGAIVGSIYRKGQVIIPTGEESLKPGDTVTVFTLPKYVNRVIDYFAE